MRGLEGVRGLREAQKHDEAVRRDGRHAAGRYERRERDLARQDDAQQHRGKDEHDRHRVPGLSVPVHASYPAGEREHAVARDGEKKPRRCHHGYASILRAMRGYRTGHSRDVSPEIITGLRNGTRTMMRPITAMIVMKMLGPLPRASA